MTRFSEFIIRNQGVSEAEAETVVSHLQNAYHHLSQQAQRIVPDRHCNIVEIHPTLKDGLGGFSVPRRALELAVHPEIDARHAFLKPLYEHPGFIPAHELYHPVVLQAGSTHGLKDPQYRDARAAAMQHIAVRHPDVVPHIAHVCQLLDGRHAAFLLEDDVNMKRYEKALSDLSWPSPPLQTHDDRTLAFYLGVLLSDSYHKAFGYTANPLRGRPDDHTYAEDLCNVSALSHVFGRERVSALAGDLLEHMTARENQYGLLLDHREQQSRGTPGNHTERYRLEKALQSAQRDFGTQGAPLTGR